MGPGRCWPKPGPIWVDSLLTSTLPLGRAAVPVTTKAPANGAATPAANRHLDAVLTEMAHAAVRSKNSYFKAQYHRLAGRRGKKRAIGAVKHSLLVTVYFMLRDNTPYKDLGVDYFDKLNPQQRIRYHVRRLQELGQEVELSPMADAA